MDLKSILIIENQQDKDTLIDGLNMAVTMYEDFRKTEINSYGKCICEATIKYRIKKAKKMIKQLKEMAGLPIV